MVGINIILFGSVNIKITNMTSIVFEQGDYLYSDIQVFKYMQMFTSCYRDVSPELIVAALIYIERLLAQSELNVITPSNGKGVLQVAMALSAKFYLDHFEKDTLFYASSLNLDKYKMRKMMNAFIDILEFKFYISDDEFRPAMATIKTMIAQTYYKLG